MGALTLCQTLWCSSYLYLCSCACSCHRAKSSGCFWYLDSDYLRVLQASYGSFTAFSLGEKTAQAIKSEPIRRDFGRKREVALSFAWKLTKFRSAEITIGIIVGCMPHINKIFRHSWSTPPMMSKFRILCTSRSESSWRRLFTNSSKSEASTSQKVFEGDVSQPVAPHIETPKLAHASPTSFERLGKFPPSLSRDKNVVTRNFVPRPNFEEHLPEKIEHVKRAIPGAERMIAPDTERQTRAPSWHEHTETRKERDETNSV